MNTIAILFVLLTVSAAAPGLQPAELKNVSQQDGVYRLAPGPNVEGVVLVHQGAWPPAVVKVFHDVPWLDAASVRLRWAELEPADQEFRWTPFERVLAEVKRFNAAHPGARRTLHVRVMGGVHAPKWFEAAGVKLYDTLDPIGRSRTRAIRIPVPCDNPEYLKQLREVYRAMVERFQDEPLVTVYHGTWSAGPWDEIFHPQGKAPLPPGYTPDKFVQGMTQQLDVLIEEFCLRGKVAELPYSGKYPPKSAIDITGPLNARIVERLGRRSPWLYIQSNGWGMTNTGAQTVSWGHERDMQDAFGQVNLALQALGTNAGGGWLPQGDWINLVEIARKYEAAYVELYPPDFTPLDTRHRMVEAFTHGAAGAPAPADLPVGFVGFRPWLAIRTRVLYVREGTIRRTFAADGGPRRIEWVAVDADLPASTSVKARVRTKVTGGAWTAWQDAEKAGELPAGNSAQVEVILHTDDGCVSPVVRKIEPVWQKLGLQTSVWNPTGLPRGRLGLLVSTQSHDQRNATGLPGGFLRSSLRSEEREAPRGEPVASVSFRGCGP